MKEIGGYLELERFSGKEYHTDCISFNTARNALRYVIRKKNIKKIALPKMSCISVIEACNKENAEIIYYSVGENFLPALEGIDSSVWIYITNYYGQLDSEYLEKLYSEYPNIIVDNVQAFFDLPVKNIPTLYSCRKFFGVPDGAYLYFEGENKTDFSKDFSFNRTEFLNGRFEKSASEFFANYQENEHFLDSCDILEMSDYTKNMMRAIDYEKALKKRRDNYEILNKEFQALNLFKPKTPFGPFMYPLVVENGMELKKKLAKRKIYISTLWPNVLQSYSVDENEYKITANLLPLPVDQRYTEEDMLYMADVIKEILSEETK